MPHIICDNPDTEKNLRYLCDVITRSGGYISEHLRFVEEEGQGGVFAEDDVDEKFSLKVPHELLIPYSAFNFDIEGKDIVISSTNADVEPEQISIMEYMLALYNDSKRLLHNDAVSPWLVLKERPDVLEALTKSREGEDISLYYNMSRDDEFLDELRLLTFFNTRLSQCRLGSRDSMPQRVFLPIIEMLNHNAQGAGYDNLYNKSGGHMGVKAVQPLKNTQECFACYGRFDALDTYLHYGFVDSDAPIVRSVPIEIETDLGWSIKVHGYNNFAPPNEIPEHMRDLKFYFPPMEVDHDKKTLSISHLFMPQGHAPFSLRRILEFIFLTIDRDIAADKCIEMIGITEKAVIQENMKYYNSLASIIENIYEGEFLDNLRDLIGMQKRKIKKYTEIVSVK